MSTIEADIPAERMILESTAALRQAQAIVVRNPAESLGAQHMRAALAYQAKALNDQRLAITRRMDQSKRDVIELFAAPIKILEDGMALIDREVIAFQLAQEEAQRAAQAQENERALKERARLLKLAEKAGDAGRDTAAETFQDRAAAVVPTVINVPTVKAKGTVFIDVWKFRVRDGSRINPAFLMPDEVKIGQVVKSTKMDAVGIVGDGIEVYVEKTVSSRRT